MSAQQDPLQNRPVAVQLGMFAMVHNNLYYWFACENKVAANTKISYCWLDIPLQGGVFVNTQC
ncbi:MAG: hypothetical protein GY696_17565 [Gammaproteobacteria bacterium]|nr:hypothetical protein [Gammaproteobacteria bacterium]